MSDLQCPARFVLLTPDTVSACDLRELRVALVVCTCPLDAATSQRLAATAGCEIQTAELRCAAELARKITELADGYRGEQVALIASPDAVCAALQLSAAPTQPVHVAVDSDGWHVAV